MTMPTRTSRHRHRRWFGLVGCIVLVAVIAQVAGVGGPRGAQVRGAKVATLPGAPVPDVASTKLASTKVRAGEGETVRMSATAQLLADALPKAAAGSGQGVCGIAYSRDGDPSWTLGVPYETLTLRRGKTAKVTIERSFAAPESDTYRMTVRCHVAAPATGAKVRGNAVISAKLGLPKGAAKPV